MSDRRLEILENHFPTPDHEDTAAILNAMDEYGKEMALDFLRYVLKNMYGHSVDAAENVEIKWKEEWLTPEQLFENFL